MQFSAEWMSRLVIFFFPFQMSILPFSVVFVWGRCKLLCFSSDTYGVVSFYFTCLLQFPHYEHLWCSISWAKLWAPIPGTDLSAGWVLSPLWQSDAHFGYRPTTNGQSFILSTESEPSGHQVYFSSWQPQKGRVFTMSVVQLIASKPNVILIMHSSQSKMCEPFYIKSWNKKD